MSLARRAVASAARRRSRRSGSLSRGRGRLPVCGETLLQTSRSVCAKSRRHLREPADCTPARCSTWRANVQAVREDVGPPQRARQIDRARAAGQSAAAARRSALPQRTGLVRDDAESARRRHPDCRRDLRADVSLAVEFARESKQTLIGFVRGETMNIYAGASGILSHAFCAVHPALEPPCASRHPQMPRQS